MYSYRVLLVNNVAAITAWKICGLLLSRCDFLPGLLQHFSKSAVLLVGQRPWTLQSNFSHTSSVGFRSGDWAAYTPRNNAWGHNVKLSYPQSVITQREWAIKGALHTMQITHLHASLMVLDRHLSKLLQMNKEHVVLCLAFFFLDWKIQ